jgi:hypothetical protein
MLERMDERDAQEARSEVSECKPWRRDAGQPREVAPLEGLFGRVGRVELEPVHEFHADPDGRERVGTQQTSHRSLFTPVACIR